MPARSLAAALAIGLLLGASAGRAEPRRVELPLLLPHAFLQRLLVEQVFSEPDGSARITAKADPCSEIVLTQPTLGSLGDRLVVTAHGRAQAGFSFGGDCFRPFSWEGEVETQEEVHLSPDAPVVGFRVVESRLLGGGGALDVPTLWDWVKPAVHPRLETLRVDLGPLIDELRRALPLFAARREEPVLRRLAESIALSDARVEARGLALHVRFDVEVAPPTAAAPPEAPLGPEQIAAFEAALREWDAFLTFVVKTAGQDALRPELRSQLLAVLIDARTELVAALAEPTQNGEDRVRALFLASWQRLAPALAELTGGDEGFRYLAFVAAGDALGALDAAGPAFGVEISSAGLRRLAGTLAPAAGEDPLRYSDDVDPELRRTFGFDVELPALPRPAEPEPPPEPPPVAPETPNPPARTVPESGAEQPLLRSLAARLAGFIAVPAFAAPAALPSPGPSSSPLDGMVPRRADLDGYLPQVAKLLRESAQQVFARSGLEPERRTLFRDLVLAAAWQESCWRQYVERRKRIEPLRSSIGALGLMQVSPRVWRGFYAVDGLAWSIGYNARAGSEILLHYLRDYAMARGEEALGGPDALARSSYALYHGGPSHLRRYRQASRWRAALVAVDRAFHNKYRAVAAGDELAVRECFAG
jgi:hypothetical protein